MADKRNEFIRDAKVRSRKPLRRPHFETYFGLMKDKMDLESIKENYEKIMKEHQKEVTEFEKSSSNNYKKELEKNVLGTMTKTIGNILGRKRNDSAEEEQHTEKGPSEDPKSYQTLNEPGSLNGTGHGISTDTVISPSNADEAK